MNIGIIGTGARATAYVSLCLSGLRDDITVKALADTDQERLEKFAGRYFNENNIPALTHDYHCLLDDNEIDAVFICTPDTTHREISIAALKKDKHILLEKPIATTINDSLAIYEETLRHNKVFRLGFVLRYTNIYGKIKDIVSKGELGQLISIEAKEMLDLLHGGSFFRRWHRFRENNGGFLNAKCSHDIDLLNWIAGVDPVYVSAFGSRSYFNPIDNAADKCGSCKLKNDCRYFFNSADYNEFIPADMDMCVYNSEKDIVDHEVVNIEYENGMTACFTLSALSAEPSSNRSMVIFGSEATLSADFKSGIIEVRSIHPKNKIMYTLPNDFSGHGGGDTMIYMNFIDSIRTDRYPDINDAKAGLMSSLVTLAAEECMVEKKVSDLRNLWNKQ